MAGWIAALAFVGCAAGDPPGPAASEPSSTTTNPLATASKIRPLASSSAPTAKIATPPSGYYTYGVTQRSDTCTAAESTPTPHEPRTVDLVVRARREGLVANFAFDFSGLSRGAIRSDMRLEVGTSFTAKPSSRANCSERKRERRMTLTEVTRSRIVIEQSDRYADNDGCPEAPANCGIERVHTYVLERAMCEAHCDPNTKLVHNKLVFDCRCP